MEILERIGLEGLIPVVVINNADEAIYVAEAIHAGGLDTMEITLRSEAGLRAISNIAKYDTSIVLGAGTVLSLEKCKAAVDSGAKFIVSPGFNRDVVEWCLKSSISVIPGCVTPTEIQMALDMGIKIVKFFPADIYGGVLGCKALAGPFQHTGLSFIPTGGVNEKNLIEYIDKPFIHAIGGGWLCPREDINNRNYSNITLIVRSAIDTILGLNLSHIGIHQADANNSLDLVKKLEEAFHWPVRYGSNLYFVGKSIEVTNDIGSRANASITIVTDNINRSIYYLEKRNFTLDQRTAIYKEGKLMAIYLDEDFGGFAVKLIQKR